MYFVIAFSLFVDFIASKHSFYACTAALSTWVVMPLITWLPHAWLRPGKITEGVDRVSGSNPSQLAKLPDTSPPQQRFRIAKPGFQPLQLAPSRFAFGQRPDSFFPTQHTQRDARLFGARDIGGGIPMAQFRHS